jgi:transcriptional regulator with XRE-family HTH domain
MPVVRDALDPRVSLYHWLAFQLRHLREANGLSLAEVGRLISAARSTVCNIEAGRGRIDDKQAFILDQHYGTGFMLQLLLYYARLGHDPEWFKQFSTYESESRVIKVYAGSVIPGPLQTPRYIRALLTESSVLDIDATIALRMARQNALLERDPMPWIWVLLDEAAIMIEAGANWVIREQLKALLDFGERDRISVRIIPMRSGVHAGADGPFRVISLESRDVAYVGAQRGGRLIEEPTEVRELAVDFDRIGQKAMSTDDTRARIEQQMETFV